MSRPVNGSRGLYVPDAQEYEALKKNLIRQKQNKYTPLVNITARNFVEKTSNSNASRGVTFGGIPIDHESAVVEVDVNPIYLRTVQDDALHTKPGEPFHPAYPGATKLRTANNNNHSSNDRMNSYGQSRGDPSLMMTMMRGGGDDGSANNAHQQRASSSPAGGNRRKLVASHRDRTILSQIDGGNFYQDAVVGTLNMIVDPFANADGSNNNARTHLDHQIAKERRDRELRELQAQATQKASLHRAHAIRHSCSDAVEVIKILLSFRGVNVDANEGPHNAVTNRFMLLEFLQDLQWLLMEGPTLIRYPSPGTGGAPHLRYFSVRLYLWAPGPDAAPVLAPFLVWMHDSKSISSIGRAPLCNLLGVTKDPNESVVLRRHVNHDGRTIDGPPVSANKKAHIPVDWCASLWFKCLVTGDMSSEGLVQPLFADNNNNNNNQKQQQEQPQQQQKPAAASPNSIQRSTGLDAETAAARGLGPAPSSPQNNSVANKNNNNNNATRARSNSPPQGNNNNNSSDRRKLQPGTLGRINIDVAATKYGDILRFVKVMEGIASVNEVLVQKGTRK